MSRLKTLNLTLIASILLCCALLILSNSVQSLTIEKQSTIELILTIKQVKSNITNTRTLETTLTIDDETWKEIPLVKTHAIKFKIQKIPLESGGHLNLLTTDISRIEELNQTSQKTIPNTITTNENNEWASVSFSDQNTVLTTFDFKYKIH